MLFGMCNMMAQKPVILKKGSFYEHEGKEYKYKELGVLLSSDPEALHYFNKSIRSKKATNISGLVSLGLMGVGSIMAFVPEVGESAGLNFVVGLSMVLASALPGTYGLITRGIFHKQKRKVLDVYNKGDSAASVYGRKVPYAKIGVQTNGVGLSLKF